MQGEKNMKIFAERLKDLRTEKGLSIQALSKEVNIGVASICRWENCQADVKGSQLVVLAKYFDVTIDYLMGLED
jgi:transcriptional regulator with XRE-family HTH domain